MFSRIISPAIVLFWAASVGWLCALVWAPPGSRMALVDPLEVYRVFFSWNDSANMTLLENGTRRGQLTVSGGSGLEPGTGEISRDLSFSGTLETYDSVGDSNLVDLFWKGTVAFSAAMVLRETDFSVRLPGKELSAHIGYSAATGEGNVRVMMAGREVLHFDGAQPGTLEGTGGLLPSLPAMIGAAGIPGGLAAFHPAMMKVETTARIGRFNFGGRDRRAYFITFRQPDQDQEIRVFLSEAGEPLKIESDLGFEAISEILVPLDAYRRVPAPEN